MGFFVCRVIGRFGLTMKKVALLLVFTTRILQGQVDLLWVNIFDYGNENKYNSGYSKDQAEDGGYIISDNANSYLFKRRIHYTDN